jgi:hypothetical protein
MLRIQKRSASGFEHAINAGHLLIEAPTEPAA